jgi:hypothetical protein
MDEINKVPPIVELQKSPGYARGVRSAERPLSANSNTLLDRAYGKAPTFSTSDTQAFKRAIDMTDDELAAIVGRAKLTIIKSDT